MRLRTEKARQLGFASFADFKLEDTMAKKPDAVADLLGLVWKPARARAAREAADLIDIARADGLNAIAPHDWRFYAEKVRQARHRIDEAEIKPYLVLDNVIAASFDVATKLFGLTFKARPDLKAYHPDVQVFEVLDAKGAHIGLFLGDYFARASKRSGAWMNEFHVQKKFDGARRPIIVNVCNFAKPADGAPALLSFIPLVWGDYWIIDLDRDYGLAAVSEPGREYLWILSRTPTVSKPAYDALVARLAGQGLDVRKLERTPQE